MNRRTFFKTIFAGVLMVVLPKPEVKALPPLRNITHTGIVNMQDRYVGILTVDKLREARKRMSLGPHTFHTVWPYDPILLKAFHA